MIITNLIAEHIRQVYEGDNWTEVCIADTISNINFQQAQQRTAGSPNTIASLLHHLYYWNEIMVQRMQGKNPQVLQTNGFDVEELKREEDWLALKEKAHHSFIQLANAVKNFPADKLNETYAEGKSTFYKNLQGTTEHAHYHLGQMVIIKKLLAQ
ncbi:DinB family protein [Parafilimonas terrae]|jgi:uncharacterized damage-inducible protein DinB|uniref:DinB superfamily protein n=1 Tax=Parafilimonas terrae TaxID=1465490 RepID=A0A1I5TLU2_9BACT|nr:DinB family protein [Parafilimonas terrae]SFP83861.1 DinB superfamily protein [Parafilimonas terrae]